jgi:hypothetical protein
MSSSSCQTQVVKVKLHVMFEHVKLHVKLHVKSGQRMSLLSIILHSEKGQRWS